MDDAVLAAIDRSPASVAAGARDPDRQATSIGRAGPEDAGRPGGAGTAADLGTMGTLGRSASEDAGHGRTIVRGVGRPGTPVPTRRA